MVSLERAKKVVEYVQEHGIEDAMVILDVNKETIDRYDRIVRADTKAKGFLQRPTLSDIMDEYTYVCNGITVTDMEEALNPLEPIKNTERRILVIGDLHAPFVREGYLQFCIDTYEKYNCNQVMFTGDILDNHYSSFHDTDPDGHSAAREFNEAKRELDKWYQAFPIADVCIGNHDAIPDRRAFSAGLSTRWVKTIGEVLGYDGWSFKESFIYDDVKYIHGTGRKAKSRAKDDLESIVQGHYHSESYIEHFVGTKFHTFAMQVGCGVHEPSYAFAYGKNFKRMHVNCGVVLDNGKLPILEYMPL